MLKILSTLFATVGLAAALSAGVSATAAQVSNIESLRGAVPLTDNPPAPTFRKQDTESGRFGRAYRQQPPMIPHEIDQYTIDAKDNDCMLCHDWPYNVDAGAPKISETHYTDRNGVALDHVSGTRWFCTQCHAPQANAKALVPNDFKSSLDVK